MIEVRPLSTHTDFHHAVQLQKEIWGFDDIELIPLRLFVVAKKIGGQTLGAFDRKRMVGFCLSIPGIKPGPKSYLHSHMLGVLPDYRDAGVGRSLKLAQREEALSRGIDLIEWTFDPLEIKNAYFNMERLGAVVRRYVPNQYGTTSSPLHGGLPTDRCIAEWWLASPRVKAAIARQPRELAPIQARISVPAEIALLRFKNPERACEIQTSIREEFLSFFDRDLAVIGFEKSDAQGTFLLAGWNNGEPLRS